MMTPRPHPLITGDVPKFLERWGGAAENRGAVQSLSGLPPAVVKVGLQFVQKQGWTLPAECLSINSPSSSDFTQGTVSTGRRLANAKVPWVLAFGAVLSELWLKVLGYSGPSITADNSTKNVNREYEWGSNGLDLVIGNAVAIISVLAFGVFVVYCCSKKPSDVWKGETYV
eukprot:GHVT01103954.1.p1 GENE.GHVT01103954.1~~GHVT01103954.1.p1  ORF type:complete len:171 (-),score=14.53 GHVT01103954.1:929-1441(-)